MQPRGSPHTTHHYTDPYPHTEAHRNPNTYANSESYPHTEAYRYADRNPNPYAKSDTNPHTLLVWSLCLLPSAGEAVVQSAVDKGRH